MTWKQKIGVLAMIASVILFMTSILSVTFFLTTWVDQRFDLVPSAFVGYLVNIVLGLISCFTILATLGRVWGSRQQATRSGVFGQIIEAMQRIAKGDFSVRLDNSLEANQLVGELANNVNTMALELHKMEIMRRAFISDVSHEIQSPLTSIRGFAQALHNDQLDRDERLRYLNIIETESTRLSRITENLLKLATLEAGQVKFEPKLYGLDKQIRTLILASEPQWVSKAIEMEVALPEVTITADEDLLSQVWMNLIHNSVKFTPQGGRICVNLVCRDDRIVFQIADTGVGISEEDQAHIFERFYKADKSRTHAGNTGSGLGLSIAHKIVEMHKGTIAVESKPAMGATFIVTLPNLSVTPKS
jgi:signal transduction histidine kinase